MATSGTTAFDLDIDDIIEEAYERCAVRTNSGRDLKSARRSLNIMFSEWSNRGVHLWKVTLNTQALTSGTETYTTPTDTSDVLEAYISSSSGTTSSTSDVALTKISRSDYAAKSNKGATGQPSEYYVDRQTTPTITLYQTPDASTYTHLKFYTVKRIEDAGAYTNQSDVAFRFIPCMVAGLAYYIAMKRSPERLQMLKSVYEEEFQRASDEDEGRTPLKLQPSMRYLRV